MILTPQGFLKQTYTFKKKEFSILGKLYWLSFSNKEMLHSKENKLKSIFSPLLIR